MKEIYEVDSSNMIQPGREKNPARNQKDNILGR
jgi:hypothetical protein